jgi:hypothetical protein
VHRKFTALLEYEKLTAIFFVIFDDQFFSPTLGDLATASYFGLNKVSHSQLFVKLCVLL